MNNRIKTLKEFIQLDEQGNPGGRRLPLRLFTDAPKPRPFEIRHPLLMNRKPRPGSRGKPSFGAGSLMAGMAKDPNFSQADDILDMIRIAANTAYTSMGTIFAELLEFYPSAFEAFRVMMRGILALDVPVNSNIAGNLLDYLYDMDIGLEWSVDANRIIFQHQDQVVQQVLNQYMGQFLGSTEGLLETLIQVLESGDSMYG